ncbi:MAG: UDP-N-acetylmuramoyl-L-alanine--D-glutamate ligase [Armatimonadetes bacterium]|nr:UDP-N-acetylmuramoyl-L-alanine--D-glutamate ligase [Armatimonadota bacterium]
MKLDGTRIAVAGMAKSGISVGFAAKELGAAVTVFDEKPADHPSILPAVDTLNAAGVVAAPGWHGHLSDEDFDMLVLSPGVPMNHPCVADMKEREVIGEIEFAYRITSDPILAITGTNGKSTTTVLTWLLLRAAGVDAVLCGNIAGSGYDELTLTDASMQSVDVLVAEVSSFQLEFVQRFRPRVAAITNITPDHLERHASFAEYESCKYRLLEKMSASDVVIVNLDERTVDPDRIPPAPRKIKFAPDGFGATSGVTARAGDRLFLSGDDIAIASLPLLGDHNLANAMMAWEMADAFLKEPSSDQHDAMLSALLKFTGLANRMELVRERGGVKFVNNSVCTNPEAIIASCRGIDGPQRLLIGGKRKNLDFAPLGEFLATSGNPAYIFGPEADELSAQMGAALSTFEDLPKAFAAAASDASDGDFVVLSPGCASAEPYANFKERGDDFRRLVEEWIAQ